MDIRVKKALVVIQEFLESQEFPVTRVILELWGNPDTQVYREFLVTPESKGCQDIAESLENLDTREFQVFRAIVEFTEPQVIRELVDTPELKVFQDIQGSKDLVATLVFLDSQGSLVIRVSRE